jgi:hypothetical protein
MPKADARECPISFVFRSKGGGLGQETRGDAKLVAALSQGGGFQPGRNDLSHDSHTPQKHQSPDSQSGLDREIWYRTLSFKHLKHNSDGDIVKRFYSVE